MVWSAARTIPAWPADLDTACARIDATNRTAPVKAARATAAARVPATTVWSAVRMTPRRPVAPVDARTSKSASPISARPRPIPARAVAKLAATASRAAPDTVARMVTVDHRLAKESVASAIPAWMMRATKGWSAARARWGPETPLADRGNVRRQTPAARTPVWTLVVPARRASREPALPDSCVVRVR
jgi:hypothetical protein